MELIQAKILSLQGKLRSIEPDRFYLTIKRHFFYFLQQIKNIGITESMDDYERRKLNVFNLLNFFQLLSGTLIPIIGLLHNDQLPFHVWLLACLPSSLSVAVLCFNYFHKYQAGLLSYFILYPFFTGFVYLQ